MRIFSISAVICTYLTVLMVVCFAEPNALFADILGGDAAGTVFLTRISEGNDMRLSGVAKGLPVGDCRANFFEYILLTPDCSTLKACTPLFTTEAFGIKENGVSVFDIRTPASNIQVAGGLSDFRRRVVAITDGNSILACGVLKVKGEEDC